MSHDEYEDKLYDAINTLLEMPLSDEAAWQILNFLQIMTKLFDERFHPQAVRHAGGKAEPMQSIDNKCDSGIPWDDKIPF